MSTREKASKWGRAYWSDLAERVGSTAVYGAITLLATTRITDVSLEVGWTIVGLPTALSLLKALAANLGGDEPTASVIDVTSTNTDSR